jgi:hypothetical protein
MKVKGKEVSAPKAPSSALTTTKQRTDLALPEDWQTELAQAAKDESAVEKSEMQAFSLKSGILTYDGNPMPNNEMNCIVVATAFEKAMFINKFDPNNIISPLCFALAPEDEDMAPHENSFKPQGNEDKDDEDFGKCHGCPQLEWGSDPSSPSGRGKMCKETRRLALLPEDALDDLAKATPAMLRIPVTSVVNWSSYVHTLAATAKRPPWTVVTKISVAPDKKNQFAVSFEVVSAINDVALLDQLKSMRPRAQQGVMNPYGLMTQEQFDEIEAAKNAPKKKAKY